MTNLEWISIATAVASVGLFIWRAVYSRRRRIKGNLSNKDLCQILSGDIRWTSGIIIALLLGLTLPFMFEFRSDLREMLRLLEEILQQLP